MPYQRREASSPQPNLQLASRLTAELTTPRGLGQPRIVEEEFPTGLFRVIVLWDEWQGIEDGARVETVRLAYRDANRADDARRMNLIMPFTIPEAVEMGVLPFAVTPLLRSSDRVTFVQLRDAMITDGASVLSDVNKPLLRFATLDEAEACLRRLIDRLPASNEVWAIVKDLPVHVG